MRIINIDLSQDSRCPQKVFGGNAREHNESKLIVKLPDRMIQNDISYYFFEFQTVLGEYIVSPNIYKASLIDKNKISVTLWEQLIPAAGDLLFCVDAVNLGKDNSITIKGKTSFCTLQILKSPTGDSTLIDISSTKEELQEVIDKALQDAKDSGDFKGEQGDVSVDQMNTAISEALAKERLITNAACANALRGSASGSSVSLTNVSPNEHTLGVKVSSKNLFTPNTTPTVPSNMGLTCTYDSTDNTFTLNGTLAANGNINLATLNIPLDDYYIARYYVSGDITAPEGVEYRSLFAMFVYGVSNQFLDRLSQRIDNYNTPIIAAEAKNIYSISSANKWTFYLQNFGIGTVFNNYKFKIAVIKKDIYYADIPYTPNVSDFSTVNVTRCGTVETDSPQTYIPAADGTVSGVKSLYPTTTLITDTVGTIIEAEYSKDINKAFAELHQAIISLGGNV